MTTGRAVKVYTVRRECKVRQWLRVSCYQQGGSGRAAAASDGLFLTTASKAKASDFVCLSFFSSYNALDGY